MSKRERVDKIGDQQKKYKNVFVKNFGSECDEAKLELMFAEFGPITSCVVMKDDDEKCKGFGFVAFETHESAEQVNT